MPCRLTLESSHPHVRGEVAMVTFEGLLGVCDLRALLAHLENGIGHAKAFRCGLLLVRRIG